MNQTSSAGWALAVLPSIPINAAVASFVCRNTLPLRFEVIHPAMRHGNFEPFDRPTELFTHTTLQMEVYVLFHNYEVAICRLLGGEIVDMKLANIDIPKPKYYGPRKVAAKSSEPRPRSLSKAARRQQILDEIANEL